MKTDPVETETAKIWLDEHDITAQGGADPARSDA